MKRQQHLLLYIIFIFSVLFFSCKESNSTLPEIDLKEMDEYVFKITSILDTAKVGDVDGTYPRESKIALQKALVDLQVGKSKADAGEFILQYEVNNYCINAGNQNA